MARPRKADGERLVPATVQLARKRFDALDSIARARRVPLSVIIRERLEWTFRERKTTDSLTSS
jgi:hypothetical protein